MSTPPKRFRSRRGAPGIVDVAALAGVSPATVSRAFMTPDAVRETTRKVVAEAARTLGYSRERSAGQSRHLYSGTVGLVVPTIDNSIFAELAAAFSQRLQALGRTMLVASHEYDLDRELEIVRSLVDRRIDAVALIGFDHHTGPVQILADRNIPILALWNHHPESALPCIGADNVEAGRLVTDHVLGSGRHDCAFLFPDTARNDRARDRLAGALAAADAAGHAPPRHRIRACPYELGHAKRLAMDMLAGDRPKAFICGNDIIAQGVIYACHEMGISVPGEIGVAGIGDFRGSRDMVPSLTTVRLPARTIGELGAETLVEMSRTGAPPTPFANQVPVQLIERRSTAKQG